MDPASRATQDAAAQLQNLYERHVAGDPTAGAELAEAIVREYGGRGSLIEILGRAQISLDDVRDELLGLIHTFVIKLLSGEVPYDPSKSPLAAYVDMALKGDARNHVPKLKRHVHEPLPEEDVGSGGFDGNSQTSQEDEVIDRLEIDAALRRLRQELEPEEQACFDLMAQGVREVSPYADALGIGHLPLADQRRTVNNQKDRIMKKLKRRAR